MKIICAGILAFLAISVDVVSEPAPERFEFEKTVAIYHLVKDGGVIYSRPQDYNEAQGFIRIYEALDQYLIELDMPGSNVFFDLDQQSILDEFVLVNASAAKSYLLKDGWFGDGEKWVPMSRQDYEKLRGVIDERKDLTGSATPAEDLKNFTARIHEAAEQNEIPEFAVHFNQKDQEQTVAASRSNTQQINTSHTEEISPGTEDVPSPPAYTTEIAPGKITKELQVISHDKNPGDAGSQNNSHVQDRSVQKYGVEARVSPYHWKWLAILALLIGSCFLYFQRRH